MSLIRWKSVSAVLQFVIIWWTLGLTAASPEDQNIEPLLKVAQCQAQCLDKFRPSGWIPSDASCMDEPNCYMCWDVCGLLNENFVVWGSMCDDDDICFPGCQQSCGFYLQGTLSAPSLSSVGLKFANPLVLVDGSNSIGLKWTKVFANKGNNNVAYALFQRPRSENKSSKWQLVTQTSEMKSEIEKASLPPNSNIVDFRLFGVTGDGQVGQLFGSYHLTNSMPQDHPATVHHPHNDSTPQVVPLWKLYLVSLQRNPQLGTVDAVITWAAPGRTGNFLVTWEVKEGTFAITGHLYTDSTTVTLSLWPATTYSIQVELVSSTLGAARRSEPLTVNADRVFKQQQQMTAVPAPTPECSNTLVIGGVSVATSLAIVVLALLFVVRRWRNRKNKVDSGVSRRKSPLPIDIEGGSGVRTSFACSLNSSISPLSSKLDEKMAAFRGFLNENMVADDEKPHFTYPPQTCLQSHTMECVERLSVDKLLISENEDGPRVEDSVFKADLPTVNLLSKCKTFRSHSTAI